MKLLPLIIFALVLAICNSAPRRSAKRASSMKAYCGKYRSHQRKFCSPKGPPKGESPSKRVKKFCRQFYVRCLRRGSRSRALRMAAARAKVRAARQRQAQRSAAPPVASVPAESPSPPLDPFLEAQRRQQQQLVADPAAPQSGALSDPALKRPLSDSRRRPMRAKTSFFRRPDPQRDALEGQDFWKVDDINEYTTSSTVPTPFAASTTPAPTTTTTAKSTKRPVYRFDIRPVMNEFVPLRGGNGQVMSAFNSQRSSSTSVGDLVSTGQSSGTSFGANGGIANGGGNTVNVAGFSVNQNDAGGVNNGAGGFENVAPLDANSQRASNGFLGTLVGGNQGTSTGEVFREAREEQAGGGGDDGDSWDSDTSTAIFGEDGSLVSQSASTSNGVFGGTESESSTSLFGDDGSIISSGTSSSTSGGVLPFVGGQETSSFSAGFNSPAQGGQAVQEQAAEQPTNLGGWVPPSYLQGVKADPNYTGPCKGPRPIGPFTPCHPDGKPQGDPTIFKDPVSTVNDIVEERTVDFLDGSFGPLMRDIIKDYRWPGVFFPLDPNHTTPGPATPKWLTYWEPTTPGPREKRRAGKAFVDDFLAGRQIPKPSPSGASPSKTPPPADSDSPFIWKPLPAETKEADAVKEVKTNKTTTEETDKTTTEQTDKTATEETDKKTTEETDKTTTEETDKTTPEGFQPQRTLEPMVAEAEAEAEAAKLRAKRQSGLTLSKEELALIRQLRRQKAADARKARVRAQIRKENQETGKPIPEDLWGDSSVPDLKDLFSEEDLAIGDSAFNGWCKRYGTLGQKFCHTSLSLRDEYAVFCRDYIKNCGETRLPDHSDLELHSRLRLVENEDGTLPEAGEAKAGELDKSLGIFDPANIFGGGILDEDYRDTDFNQIGDIPLPEEFYVGKENETYVTGRQQPVIGGRRQQSFSDTTGFEFNGFLNGGGLAPTNQNGRQALSVGQFFDQSQTSRNDWARGDYSPREDRYAIPLFGNTFTTYIDERTNVPVFGGNLDTPTIQGREKSDAPFWEPQRDPDIDWFYNNHRPNRRYYEFGRTAGKAFGQRRVVDNNEDRLRVFG